MFNSQTTNNPGGVTNAAPRQTMAMAGTPDPTWSQLYVDDFNQFLAAQYSIVGVGTPVVVAVAGKGGLVSMTTSAAVGDSTNLQLAFAGFQAVVNKQLFFKAQITPVTSPTADIAVGLFPVGATPLAATDFIGFICATGQRAWIFRSRIGSVNTDTPLPTNLVAVDGTPIELGFHIDLQGNVEIFFNPTTGNVAIVNPAVSIAATRGRVASLQAASTGPAISLTQVLLAPTVSVRTQATSASVVTVDYLVCSSER